MKTSNILLKLDKINKIPLYLAVFFVPIFFLFFSQDSLAHPKHLLLLALLIVSLIGWFLKQLVKEEIEFKKQKFFYWAAASLLVSSIFSSIFSIWQNGSIWGWPLNISESLIAILSFILFAFLIANSFQEEKKLFFTLKLLLISGAIVSLFAIFQGFGKFILPFALAKSPLFGLMAFTGGVAIMAAILLPLALFVAFTNKGYWKWAFILISIIFFLALLLINLRTAWGLSALSFVALFLFNFKMKREINFVWISVLMLLLVLSLFFFFFPLRFIFLPNLPMEVSLNTGSGLNILNGVFQENSKNIFIGTGPGTFVFDYSKFHSPTINQTIFWGNRFLKGTSMFLDWLTTQGIIGATALFSLIGWALYTAGRNFLKLTRKKKDYSSVTVPFFISFAVFIVASFFYSFDFVLWFIFWLYMGILLFYSTDNTKKIRLKTSPYKSSIFIFVFVMLIVLCISGFFLQTKKYVGDAYYFQGVKESQANETDNAITDIERAIELNPKYDLYWRDLGQLYLTRADTISKNKNLGADEQKKMTYDLIAKGTEAINRASSLVPSNVANWNVRGYFYRTLIGIGGAGELSLSSYRKAIELEPASPFAYGEMGRVYMLIAQNFSKKEDSQLRNEAISLAVIKLNKALELKPDYAPAHYLLAVAYDQQNNLDEAIAKLEETKLVSSQDAGVAFQLGLLYWRKDELSFAENEFKRALALKSNYSNARYMLGLVYDKKGEEDKARVEFEAVIQDNPDNQNVKDILENIQNGLPATQGINLSQPPIQDEVPEIKN